MRAKEVLGQEKEELESKKHGMGTVVSEYSEAGPFSCMNCWYLQSTEPRTEAKGHCTEPHVTRDPEVEKVTIGGKKLAVVNKFYGCCRFVDPVVPRERKDKFVFAGDPEEEAEEHG